MKVKYFKGCTAYGAQKRELLFSTVPDMCFMTQAWVTVVVLEVERDKVYA
jgi:hypothetical protein